MSHKAMVYDKLSQLGFAPNRILCCGDREWKDEDFIFSVLSHLPPDTIIIEGECRGADKLSKAVALKMFPHAPMEFPALWTRYGNGAGPIRNLQMLQKGQPHAVVAFHDNIVSSTGTKNMITQALNLTVAPVYLFGHDYEIEVPKSFVYNENLTAKLIHLARQDRQESYSVPFASLVP